MTGLLTCGAVGFLLAGIFLPGTVGQRMARAIGPLLCAIAFAPKSGPGESHRPFAVLVYGTAGTLLSLGGWIPLITGNATRAPVRRRAPRRTTPNLPIPSAPVNARPRPSLLNSKDFAARVVEGRTDDGRAFLEVIAEIESGRHLRVATRDWRGEFHPDARMNAFDVADWPYAVHATDAAFAASLLAPPLRLMVEQTDAMHDGAFVFEVRPTVVVVRAEGVSSRSDWQFHEAALAIARAVFLLIEGPAAPVHIEALAPAAAGTCEVCGCALERDLVYCMKCRTPHHADCWRFARVCSVYACGGKTSTRSAPGPKEDVLVIDDVDARRRLTDPFEARLQTSVVGEERPMEVREFTCELPVRGERWLLGRGRRNGVMRPAHPLPWTALGSGWQGAGAILMAPPAVHAAATELASGHAHGVVIDVRPGRLEIKAAAPVGEGVPVEEFTAACYRLASSLR